MKITEFISKTKNYFDDHRRIYIDKASHPFWSTYQTHPPVKYTFEAVSNLNHFHGRFPRFPKVFNKPFIVEIEHPLLLSGKSRDYEYMLNSVDEIKIRLENSLCKRIIVPSKGCINEIKRYFNLDINILNEIEIIRPVVENISYFNENKFKDEKFKILVVGNKFFGKGIHLIPNIFDKIKSKDVEITIISNDVPHDFEFDKSINVLNIGKMSKKIKADVFHNAHLFLLPNLQDSFTIYLDAMSYGVPVLTTNIYDKDELILDGKTGFLVETPLSMYDGEFGIKWKTWDEFQQIAKEMFENGEFEDMIEEMVSKIEILINDRELLKSMSIESQKYQQQEFSIEKRNKDILKIYDEVLEEIK